MIVLDRRLSALPDQVARSCLSRSRSAMARRILLEAAFHAPGEQERAGGEPALSGHGNGAIEKWNLFRAEAGLVAGRADTKVKRGIALCRKHPNEVNEQDVSGT